MKEKILRMLAESGDRPLSGQEICDALRCSRTAVWKVINSLKEEGYEFEAATNRGYRLLARPDTLTDWEIGSRLETERFGCRREAYFRSEISTNTIVKKLAEEGAPEGTLVTADIQEGGKGRRGREWVTPPPGANIAMSLLIRPRTDPQLLSPVTLVAAMAVRRAVEEIVLTTPCQDSKTMACHAAKERLTGDCTKPLIKWPNDIVLNGGKLTGILTELAMEEDRVSYAVVGIGINVNNTDFPKELRGKATSMYLETGRKWSRAQLVANVCKHFEELYEIFEERGFAPLREEYEQALAGLGRKAMIMDRVPWEGEIRGVTETGAVRVCDAQGVIHDLSSGEISIRGINGYSP